jgi:hypothetical protein
MIFNLICIYSIKNNNINIANEKERERVIIRPEALKTVGYFPQISMLII